MGRPASGARPRPDRYPTPRPTSRCVRTVAALALTPPLRLAVARHAVPAGSAPRTGCDRCGTTLAVGGAALGPAARCPGCRARVGAPPGSVEVCLVVALAVLMLVDATLAERAAIAWWLGWAIPLVLVDLAVHRLPDRLTGPATAGVLALLGLAAATGSGIDPWWRAVAAGAGLGLAFAATTLLLGRRGFGLGDAKLAVGVGALLGWYGWPVLLAGLVLTFASSAVTSLGLLLARKVTWSSHLPFGPFLVLGTGAALLLAR
ncbi:A24 family peptidase [Micromonospora sp. KC721]|uniref:prepilin peptidase n=1 Tax=Micromonospora sp. KC721 TaxID=2530380 RepID=UPI00104402D4|nr:A24 family peptidase [Micromonospora sp. KC721]TDB81540.1 prepilin peptidase [Micromonospora sp. KC721]